MSETRSVYKNEMGQQKKAIIWNGALLYWKLMIWVRKGTTPKLNMRDAYKYCIGKCQVYCNTILAFLCTNDSAGVDVALWLHYIYISSMLDTPVGRFSHGFVSFPIYPIIVRGTRFIVLCLSFQP